MVLLFCIEQDASKFADGANARNYATSGLTLMSRSAVGSLIKIHVFTLSEHLLRPALLLPVSHVHPLAGNCVLPGGSPGFRLPAQRQHVRLWLFLFCSRLAKATFHLQNKGLVVEAPSKHASSK